MIYRDKYAILDTDRKPANRGGLCINCRRSYDSHYGWNCNPFSNEPRFTMLVSKTRYLTQSMADSIAAPAQVKPGAVGGPQIQAINPPKPVGKDMSDWRNWAHNRPGECKCGIPRSRCTYHG